MRSAILALITTLGALGCQTPGSIIFDCDDDDTTDGIHWGDDDDNTTLGDDDSAEPEYLGCTSLADFPLCYATQTETGNYDFNAGIVVGINAPATETLAATDIAFNLDGYILGLGTLYVDPTLMTLDSDLMFEHTTQNLVSVGQTNSLTEALHGNLTLPLDTGRLELFVHHTGYTTLVVDGDTPNSTRMAAQALISQDLPDSPAAYVLQDGEEYQIIPF